MEEQTYPIVHRIVDPLVIRPSRFALQVNDTTYYAKVKFGVQFCGFLVYISGIGYNFYEYKDEELTQRWSKTSKQSGQSISSTEVQRQLEEEAETWINNLQDAILALKSGSELKKAIDRLCWQMHYDLTESDTDFTQFDDFSDVEIDKTDSQHIVHTIYDTINTSATSIGTAVGDGANVIIGNNTDSNGLWLVSNSISTLNTALTDASTGALKTQIGDKLYRESSGVIVENTVAGMLNKVATNLRADDDGITQREYTISKALRDVSDNPNYSVSHATYQQTQLELEHFTTISTDQLGAFGTGGNGTLYSTLGTAGDTSASQTVFGKVAAVKAQTDGISGIGDAIGDADTGNTLWYDVLHNSGTKVVTATMDADSTANKIKFMRELMYGDGITGGYVTQGTGTYYVKTSD